VLPQLLENTRVERCTALQGGGCLYVQGHVEVVGASLVNCSSFQDVAQHGISTHGGAAFVSAGGTLNLLEATVSGHAASPICLESAAHEGSGNGRGCFIHGSAFYIEAFGSLAIAKTSVSAGCDLLRFKGEWEGGYPFWDYDSQQNKHEWAQVPHFVIYDAGQEDGRESEGVLAMALTIVGDSTCTDADNAFFARPTFFGPRTDMAAHSRACDDSRFGGMLCGMDATCEMVPLQIGMVEEILTPASPPLPPYAPPVPPLSCGDVVNASTVGRPSLVDRNHGAVLLPFCVVSEGEVSFDTCVGADFDTALRLFSDVAPSQAATYELLGRDVELWVTRDDNSCTASGASYYETEVHHDSLADCESNTPNGYVPRTNFEHSSAATPS
jgi:hypothetical protein